MASFDELVKKYKQRIIVAKDKNAEIQNIILNIDDLIYSDTKKPLSDDDKLLLIRKLRESFLSTETEEQNFSREYRIDKSLEILRIHEATDNSEIIKIIANIEAKRKGE